MVAIAELDKKVSPIHYTQSISYKLITIIQIAVEAHRTLHNFKLHFDPTTTLLTFPSLIGHETDAYMPPRRLVLRGH